MIQYDIKLYIKNILYIYIFVYIYIYAENQCREVLEFLRSTYTLFYLHHLRKIGKIFVVLCENTTKVTFKINSRQKITRTINWNVRYLYP